MSITEQDVKLYQSEVLADSDDGGGHMTGNEVVDGALNNLFADISSLDRVYGRVSLRKAFLAVTVPGTDTYYGAHAIITGAPGDGNVSVSMMSTGSASDRRSDAVTAIENYLVAGPVTPMTLYGPHVAGSRQVLAYQETTYPLPQVGDTIVLSIESGSQSGTQQYVRITGVAAAQRDFVLPQGIKRLNVLTLDIGTPLAYNFPGADVQFYYSLNNSPTLIRSTSVAAGAKYASISKLAQNITANDVTLKVDSIFTHIVPSAERETSVLDQQLGGDTSTPQQIGPALTENHPALPSANGLFTVVCRRAILPGSLSSLSLNSGAITFADNGDGTLNRTSGNSTATATVNYATGTITVNGLANDSYTSAITYTPAVFTADVSNTAGVAVTQGNQGLIWNGTLVPLPARGTFQLTYRALGRWYTVRDQGNGQIKGDAGVGSGTINYATGSFNVTLGALPDIGTSVLWAWGTPVNYAQATDTANVTLGAISLSLGIASGTSVVPGSLSLAWNDGQTRTVTDDGAGNLTGYGTGTIDYATGAISLVPTTIPGSTVAITASCQVDTAHSETPTTTVSGGNVSFTLGTPPASAGSVKIVAVYAASDSSTYTLTFVDSGSTLKLVASTKNGNRSAQNKIGTNYGSINLTTGATVLPQTLTGALASYTFGSGSWGNIAQDLTFQSLISASYLTSPGSPQSYNATLHATTLVCDVGRNLVAQAVDGSFLVKIAGRTYYDRGGALYYRDANDNEVAAGTFDTSSGKAIITDFPTGAPSPVLEGLLTAYGTQPMLSVTWRVPGSPVRVGSFQVTYEPIGGTLLQATADNNGNVTGTGISGTINYQTGVYALTFTSPGVVPQQSHYDAVIVGYLALDPDLLGLDPTRLPLDGRVPHIEQGDVIVIHNTRSTTLPNPVSPGTPYSVGRTRLSYAHVYDAAGTLVTTDKYTADLDAGTVTFLAPLDLSGYTQPLSVEHRIEDMVLVSDAQISGDISIIGVISHNFDATDTYVSSALTFGDLRAQAKNLFSQQTWTGVWSDSPIGNGTSAQYDVVHHPIEVTDQGAATERWRIEFTSINAFKVVGETFGQIVASSDTSTDLAPINPATGAPYFTIRAAGWGTGWQAGNVVRFNTIAAGAPIWFVRTTLAGPVQQPNDNFKVQLRGDAN